MPEYINIVEFAKIKKISINEAIEIYNQNPQYTKNAGGIKYISISLLDNKEDKEEEQANENRDIEIREIEIKELKKEIERLKDEIKKKDDIISDYAFKFSELAQTAQQIAIQSQVLQVQSANKMIESNEQKKKGIFSFLIRKK